jgi:signal transduction histidine kinase
MSRVGLLSARFSLRVRLTVFAAAAAAVVLTVGALLLYDGLASALDNAVTAELRVRADDVAVEVAEGAPLPTGSDLITQVLTDDGRVLEPPADPPIASAAETRAAGSELIVDRPIAGIGTQARLLLRSVRLGDGTSAVVAVAGSTAPIERAQDRLVVVLGAAGPVMVMVVAAMAWLLTGAALRPVARMTRRAATISLREPDARLPQPRGRDEIAQLAATLNAMLDRIAETVAHERAFIDNASHELRSPLAVLRSELELARLELNDEHDSAEMRRTLDSGLEETDRLIALTERLLVLARADAGRLVGPPEAVDLDELLCRTVDRVDAGDVGVELRRRGAVALADPLAVEQLVTNLIANAARWGADTDARRGGTGG